jgi:hypothetical protein
MGLRGESCSRPRGIVDLDTGVRQAPNLDDPDYKKRKDRDDKGYFYKGLTFVRTKPALKQLEPSFR